MYMYVRVTTASASKKAVGAPKALPGRQAVYRIYDVLYHVTLIYLRLTYV